jgi:uncharacterized protein YggE
VNRTVIAAPLAALAIGGAFVLGGHGIRTAAAADVPATTSGVVVDGLGKVTGIPDFVRATLGVSLQRADVGTALRDANALQSRVTAALRKDGLTAKDVQTSDVSLYPSYDSKGHRNGYQISETLTAKLPVAKAGQGITDAVLAGGNSATLQGVGFELEDNTALLDAARSAAFADAKTKAERYASLSGRSLGDLQLVTESVTAPEARRPYADKAAVGGASAAASAVPISAGSQQVSVSVTVRWALR